ncbi:MAG: PEP-CTERM sorting domain-containing protein [Planctomycetes bacterium]|nr:PEP-CTERM sorting domain-containing protein [Planctomycetota bacterium]
MIKHGSLGALVATIVFWGSSFSLADFTFNLTISGRGAVLVSAGGPTTTYETTPSQPIDVANDFAKLVAIPTSIDITGVSSPVVALQQGDNLKLDLPTILGSKFIEWTGSFVPSIDPNDPNPEPQDPTDNTYFVYQPVPSEVKSIQANFSSDIASVGIDEVAFSFDGQNTWVMASEWNFTGDDDLNLPPSFSGNTTIVMNWDDLMSQVIVGQLNPVNLRITDKTGSQFFDGFDLDVFTPSSVPEPSSIVLLSLSAAVFLGVRSRRRVR